MRILFVADGRSPTAINWIQGILDLGHEVHLVSTYPCNLVMPLASLTVVPVAFSALGGSSQPASFDQRKVGDLVISRDPEREFQEKRNKRSLLANWKFFGGKGASQVRIRTVFRHWLSPLTLPRAARSLAMMINKIQPDLVHAMRIPYEGMLAGKALKILKSEKPGSATPPLFVSIWGNDFTLHAPSTPWMSRLTYQTLSLATAIYADCKRDIRLAYSWGFQEGKPFCVLPGGGGIQLDVFFSNQEDELSQETRVINPRGIRAYVRNDMFFRSIPHILEKMPQTLFICPGMAGDRKVLSWVSELGIEKSVRLLTSQARSDMAVLFRRSQVIVSPSTHDGTPNTLLEAMACGCFPVAGDLESIREWITPGVNGYLVDPGNPEMLARAVLIGLENHALRQTAREINLVQIATKAEYRAVMLEAAWFYMQCIHP